MNKILFTILTFFCLTIASVSQTPKVPLELQIPLFNKIFQYERNITSCDKEKITVGIVYQSHIRKSQYCRNECVKHFSGVNQYIGNKRISLVDINIVDPSDISVLNTHIGLDIIVICPLRSIDLREISKLCKSGSIITYSLIPSYVFDYNLSVAIESIEAKPQITINLKSARQEGANFSSQLLKLAKVINK